ncbi:MAG: thioredoxin family protein, partial [Eubacterium sp.]
TEQAREMIVGYEGMDLSDIEVEIPDYDHLERPFIEVFTLDSVQCAACTYMMAAATRAKEKYGDQIDIIEYKYTVKENMVRCQKMGITNLPTMVINGEIKHVSIIPDNEELSQEIEALL